MYLTRAPVEFKGLPIPPGTVVDWTEALEADPEGDSDDLDSPGVLMRGRAHAYGGEHVILFYRRDVIEMRWKYPLRQVISRDDETEALECGHSIDRRTVFGKAKRRECVRCQYPAAAHSRARRLVEQILKGRPDDT